MVSFVSAFFVEVVNTVFVGHLGDEVKLAGVGMANMYINILILSISYGLSSSLNTLISQSYGQKDYRLCGIYLNRARILITIVFIPMIFVLLYTETIFIVMGFEPMASHYS